MHWGRRVLDIVAVTTALVGLAAGQFGTLNLFDKGFDKYLTWAETQGVPTWVSSVTRITTRNGQWEGFASGVVLDTFYVYAKGEWHTYILTAAHVVQQTYRDRVAKEPPLKCRKEKTGPRFIEQEIRALGERAEVLTVDTASDLALIKIVTPKYPQIWLNERYVDVQPVTLSTRTPKPGEEIWSFGFPSETRVIARGYVGEGDGERLYHSAGIAPGSSGGGVFLDDKLVGINVAVFCEPDGSTSPVPAIAVGVEAIQELLKDEYSYVGKTDEIVVWKAEVWR